MMFQKGHKIFFFSIPKIFSYQANNQYLHAQPIYIAPHKRRANFNAYQYGGR